MRMPNLSQPVNRSQGTSAFHFDKRSGIKPAAQNECPDPTTIMNPETGECVSKFGCKGQCLLKSFGASGFNPVSFAVCLMVNCHIF